MVSIRILSSRQGYLQEVSVLFASDLHSIGIIVTFEDCGSPQRSIAISEISVRIGAFLSSQLPPDCVTAAAIGTFLQKKGASRR
jgi:hypothetical protein